MVHERMTKPHSEVSVLLIWMGVAAAYVGWIAVGLSVMLQLASGYGTSFLGIGPPPDTAEFRHVVGLLAAIAYVLSAAGSAFAMWRGDRTVRCAAALPAMLSVLALLSVVVGAFP